MSELNNENSNKKPRLGRGLGSLLGGSGPDLSSPSTAPALAKTPPLLKTASPEVGSVPPESRIWMVSIDKLQASQFQPRTHFDKKALEELSSSIRQNGILQPIVARRLDSQKFEIIAGERRWRAAQLAGLHEVPVIVRMFKNQEALELAIIENIQREDLNPIEEAEAYQRLVEEFHLTQQQVADKVGKERATVANTLRLLQLPPSVRVMVSKAEISAGHAKVLLSVADPKEQSQLAQRVLAESLTVRQLEKMTLAQKSVAAAKAGNNSMGSNVTQRLIQGLSDELQKIMGTKVQIDYQNAKGKIAIHFYSDEELTQLVERLKLGCRK